MKLTRAETLDVKRNVFDERKNVYLTKVGIKL